MASGDVVLEFATAELHSMSIDPEERVGQRLSFPTQYVFLGGSYELPNDETFAWATITVDGTFRSDVDLGYTDSARTAFNSLFDGTKRYKITVTEV